MSNRKAHPTTRSGNGVVHQRGFSLVELLVVIGIIALLIGILMPVLSRAREQSRRTDCLANLRSLGQAMFMYANNHKDRLPNGNLRTVFIDYAGANRVMVDFADMDVKAPAVFHCPSDNDPVPSTIATADQALPDSARISYDFFCLYFPPELGPILSKLRGRAPLAWDIDGGSAVQTPNQNHGNKGGNVVYSDGHASWADTGEWDDTNWPKPAAEFYPQ